jgi:hypothetical protein
LWKTGRLTLKGICGAGKLHNGAAQLKGGKGMDNEWESFDFSECINHRDHNLRLDELESVLFARGVQGREYADWTGDFILKLKDGRFAVLSGWSDSSGWG